LRELVKASAEIGRSAEISYEVVITTIAARTNRGNPERTRGATRASACRNLAFNCGESAAELRRLKAARGKYLFTLDADLQKRSERPAEISGAI